MQRGTSRDSVFYLPTDFHSDPLEAEDRPNDPQCATITFDTGVAQGSALSPLLFLIFMNALLGLITDRGQKLSASWLVVVYYRT